MVLGVRSNYHISTDIEAKPIANGVTHSNSALFSSIVLYPKNRLRKAFAHIVGKLSDCKSCFFCIN